MGSPWVSILKWSVFWMIWEYPTSGNLRIFKYTTNLITVRYRALECFRTVVRHNIGQPMANQSLTTVLPERKKHMENCKVIEEDFIVEHV